MFTLVHCLKSVKINLANALNDEEKVFFFPGRLPFCEKEMPNLTTFPTKVLGIERKVIGQHHASAVLYEHRFIQNQQTIPILAMIIDYHHFKNNIRDGGSTVFKVYSIQTALHCLNSSVCTYIYCSREG